MPSDINDLDVNDIGLKGIFGDRFHDETESSHHKATSDEMKKAYNAKPVLKPRDADFEPVAPNQMDKVKACAKSTLIYGGLSLLFFYFQQSGQMLPSAAMPCICACCVLAGLGVGKNAR